MEIDFSQLNWSSMMADTFNLKPKQDPRDVYPEVFGFKEYFEDLKDVDVKKVLRYIPMVYDRNSPLSKYFTDLRKLKIKAADLAGFVRQEDGRFLSNVEQVLVNENVLTNAMITRYVITHKSSLYSRYVMYNEVYHREMELMLSGQRKGKFEDFDNIGDKLDEIRQSLYNQDNNPSLFKDLDRFYIDDKLKLRPEDIADKVKEAKEQEKRGKKVEVVPEPLKKKVEEVPQRILRRYKKEDEYVKLNDDPDLHPLWIKLPKCEDITQVDGYGLEIEDQYWRRPEMPQKLKLLIEDCDTLEEVWDRLESNQLEYSKELRWIQDQIYYSLNGYWFFNHGKPTYIVGWHYDYLTHWKFGDDISPEYRDRDRKWYHGLYYAYTTTETIVYDKKRIVYENEELRIPKMRDLGKKVFVGYIGPKGRRAGDSNKFLCASYMETQRHKKKISGIISSSGAHAKTKLFDEILVTSWQQMPFFYKPTTNSNENPDKEIKFFGKRAAADKAKTSKQLRSKMNYSETSESTFYDGGKVFWLDVDEAGKTPDVDVYQRHQQLKECASQGAGANIVGFLGYPSTVGEMESSGGKQYSKLAKGSFWEKRTMAGQTSTGLLLIYISVLEGLEGFVDRYGMSVIDDPTPEQAKFIGKEYGARKHLLSQRQALLDENNTEEYNEFVRLFPIWFKECFRSADGDIGFNSKKINDRLEEISLMDSDLTRTGNFEWTGQPWLSKVKWSDNPKGKWKISQLMPEQSSCRFTMININGEMQRVPINPRHVTSCDPYKQEKVSSGRMSDGGIATVVDMDPHEMEVPVHLWKSYRFVCTYLNRPGKTSLFYDDVLMQCMYFNSWLYPEMTIPGIVEYAYDKKMGGYLLYDIDWKTGKPKPTPGFNPQGARRQDLFNCVRDYIEDHAQRECHADFLEQCREIESMDDMTDYDLFTAGAGALLGVKSKIVSYHRENPEDKTSTRKWPYKKKKYT